MIKLKDILKELAQEHVYHGDLLDTIKNIEKLNKSDVNKETVYKLLTDDHKAKFIKFITVGNKYALFSEKDSNQYIDYYLNCKTMKIEVLIVYEVDSNRMIENVVWKYKDQTNTTEQYLCKNLYLGHYFDIYDAIISDKNISEVSVRSYWSMLIVASLAKGYHAAIVEDKTYRIVKDIKQGEVMQSTYDNFHKPMSRKRSKLDVEDIDIEKLNIKYGSNVRTNRFMIYK